LKIIIYGCGGHAKVVADIIEKTGKDQIVSFIDDTRNDVCMCMDYPVYNSICDSRLEGIIAGVVAIGDNCARAYIVNKIIKQFPGFRFITAIHPASQIGLGVIIGEGTVVMSGVSVNVDTSIGRHCIINTSSSIDHDCKIGDYVSVAPGVVMGGNVSVGESTAVGLGSRIIHKISIGRNTVIGAGSLVTRSVADNIVAYGSPCKFVRNRNYGDLYL